MESSNQNSSGQSNVEPTGVNVNRDWRDQLTPDTRQNVINEITKVLTKYFTTVQPEMISKVPEISIKYEEKIYQRANSQPDYLTFISRQLRHMNTQFKQPSNDGKPLESGSSSLQPQVHAQQQSLANSVAANPWQVPKQIVFQSGPNITSREQGSAALQPSPNVVSQNSNMHNVSALNLSQYSQLRSSQQTVLQTPSSVQSPINQSASFASLQHNQQHQLPQSMLHRRQQHTVVTPQQQQSPQSMLQWPQQHTAVAPQQQQSPQSMLHLPQQHTVVTPQQQQSQQSMLHRPQQHTVVTPQQHQSPQSILRRPQQHTVLTPRQQQSPQSILHRPQQHTVVTPQQQQSPQSMLHRPQQHTVLTPQQQKQGQVIRQHIRGTSIGQQPNLQQQTHPPNLQQRLMTQQNSLPIAQQWQLGSRSSVSGLSHNHSSHVMPQSKVSLQQRPQQAGASMIAAQSQLLQLTKASQPSVSGSLQNVVEQQTQSDRHLIEPASGSTGTIGHGNSGDWQEEVYQKIQSMKAMYLPALQQIHQKAVGQLEKETYTATLTTDETERVRRYKTKLEEFMEVLQCSKSDISSDLKETWPLYEKNILNYVNYRRRKPMPSNQNSMTRSQNTSVSQQYRPSNISAQGDTVMSSGSLQTNSGNGNNSSMSSQTGKDMVHRNVKSHMSNSMVSNQLEQKTLQRLKQHEQHQSMQNREQQLHQEARHNISQEAVHEYPSGGQETAYSLQSLKQGSKYQLSSSQQLQAASPPSAVCTSPHPDQNNILSPNVNSGTPLRSSNSPTVVPVKSGHQQTPAPSIVLGTPELNNADGSNESSLAVVCSESIVTEKPIERLMRAVASISTEALISAERDITAVAMLVDRLAASTPGENSRGAIGNYLAADTKSFLRAGISPLNSMCRHFNPEPIAINSFKRQRMEDADPLSKEMREINQQLFDTVVDIVDNEVDPSAVTVSSKGTIVTFSTVPVTLGPQLKSHFAAHRLQIQPLHFLVPSSYPDCAPILLDDVSADISNKEDLGSKALERFKLTLRTLSEVEVKSLKTIARTWEACARAVISEYAKQLGFRSFTPKASAWETCL